MPPGCLRSRRSTSPAGRSSRRRFRPPTRSTTSPTPSRWWSAAKRPRATLSSPLGRWSSAEALALEDISFLTDHQVGDTRPPWTARQQERRYRRAGPQCSPERSDGGGRRRPPQRMARSTMRCLLPRMARELFADLAADLDAPHIGVDRRADGAVHLPAGARAGARAPWLATLAALLVAYQPMFGFISGSVNNDVGVNAGAAALELLLIRMLRRGDDAPVGCCSRAVCWPCCRSSRGRPTAVSGPAVALLLALLAPSSPGDASRLGGLALGAVWGARAARCASPACFSPPGNTPGMGAPEAITGDCAYSTHELSGLPVAGVPAAAFRSWHPISERRLPAFVIFVERGWGAFGWYDVFFRRLGICRDSRGAASISTMARGAPTRVAVRASPSGGGARSSCSRPSAVVAGFEAAFYTPGRQVIAEFGRYAFPAIAPLAVLAVGFTPCARPSSGATAGTGLLVAMIGLSYASQLLTLTAFYA